MANVIIDDTHLTNIADAIRSKNGSIDTYTPAQMAAAISAIQGGGSKTIKQTRSLTNMSDRLNAYFTVPDDMTSVEQIIFFLVYQTSSGGAELSLPFYIRDYAQYQINSQTKRYWMPIGRFPSLGWQPTTDGDAWVGHENDLSYQGEVVQLDRFLNWDASTSSYSWQSLTPGSDFHPNIHLAAKNGLTNTTASTSLSNKNCRIFVLYEV